MSFCNCSYARLPFSVSLFELPLRFGKAGYQRNEDDDDDDRINFQSTMKEVKENCFLPIFCFDLATKCSSQITSLQAGSRKLF